MTDDRGLSEALGFVLVFSLIVTSVGVAYVYGIQGLQDTRDAERVNNAERAFDVLADNVEDLSQRRAPSRATEVKLADARLTVGDPVSFNLSVPGHGFAADATVTPIVYDSGDGTRLLYVNGAIVREQRDGSSMARSPDFHAAAGTLAVPIIQTRTRDSGIAGSTTVLIRTEVSKTSGGIDDVGSRAAYLNVTTPRPDPWRRYLEERSWVDASGCTASPDPDGTMLSCELDGSIDTVAGSVLKVDYSYTS